MMKKNMKILRTVNLGSNFTGSFKKSVHISKYIFNLLMPVVHKKFIYTFFKVCMTFSWTPGVK